jgi:hypothetical protein
VFSVFSVVDSSRLQATAMTEPVIPANAGVHLHQRADRVGPGVRRDDCFLWGASLCSVWLIAPRLQATAHY